MDQVYREQGDRVFRTCLRFAAGDRAWARDRTHDVFVTLAERADELVQRDDPGGWLYRVAVNCCFMELRRGRTWRRLLERWAEPVAQEAPSPEGEVGARRSLTALETVLSQLPAKQRAVMVLVHLEDKSQNEAAALLGLSKGQVSKLHTRAQAALRQQGWTVADA